MGDTARGLVSLVSKTEKESETNQMQSVVSMSQPSFPIRFDLWTTANKRLHERRRSQAKVAWHRASIQLRESICCYSDPRQITGPHLVSRASLFFGGGKRVWQTSIAIPVSTVCRERYNQNTPRQFSCDVTKANGERFDYYREPSCAILWIRGAEARAS